jgi:hypothetical protein
MNSGGALGGTVGGVTVGQRQTVRRQRLDLHVIGQRLTIRGYVSSLRGHVSMLQVLDARTQLGRCGGASPEATISA